MSNREGRPYAIGLVALIALALLPMFGAGYYLNLLTIIFYWIGLAGCWNLMCGYTGYIDFGSAAYIGVGSYVAGVLMVKTGVPAVAAVAYISPAHFIRCFRAVFGETPHRYLQRRRVERAVVLLRETDRSVTDICFDVGFTSPGTFSRTFREIVGETPSGYRAGHGPIVAPHCVQLAAMRPRVAAGMTTRSSSLGEASAGAAP